VKNEITYVTGDERVLDDIKELWEELNRVHLEKSRHFKQRYMDFTYQKRKEFFMSKAENGKLLVVIACHDGRRIGYCVSSVADTVGEIESIYIKPEYRGNHVGKTLMETSLNWIKASDVRTIHLTVAAGNEDVFEFYSKFGFAPIRTELQQV
jgi:ribosomal protein S18 acetylase RimI-like enzyme